MDKNQRILIEALTPPMFAVLWLLIFGSHDSETLSDILLGFFPLVTFAYMFAFFPAIIYTVVMELWFHFGMRARCGLFCTTCLSGALGAAGGYSSALIGSLPGFLTPSDCFYFLRVGFVAGLLIGFYVSRKQTPAASYDGSRGKD